MNFFAPNVGRMEAQQDRAGLMEALRNGRPEIRAQAAQALARLRVVEAVPVLVYLRNDPNTEVAVSAGVALAELSESYPLYPYFDILVSVATDPRVPGYTRDLALSACMAMDILRTEAALNHTLQMHQQALAHVQVGDMQTVQTYQPAINLIQTTQRMVANEKTRREIEWVRQSAWYDVGRWLTSMLEKTPQLSPALVEAALERPDVVQGDPLLMLRLMSQASPAALGGWIRTLQEQAGCGAIALVNGLMIEDPALRDLAYRVLGEYRFPNCRDEFLKRATDAAQPAGVRLGATLGLALIDPAAAAEPVIALLQQGSHPFLLDAARRIEDPRVRDALIAAWEHTQANIAGSERNSWIRVLSEYGYPGVLQEYIAWLLREGSTLREDERKRAIAYLEQSEEGRKALPLMLSSVLLRAAASDALLDLGEAGTQAVVDYLRQAPKDEAQRVSLWLSAQPVWWQQPAVQQFLLSDSALVEALTKSSRDPLPIIQAWLRNLPERSEPLAPVTQTYTLDEASRMLLETARRHPSRAYRTHTLQFAPAHFEEIRDGDSSTTTVYLWRTGPDTFVEGSKTESPPAK